MYRERIRQTYPELSRSYRLVADYVLGTYFDVAFMTAAEVAQTVGVDTTTVVRFAQRLGYAGYPGLLTAIREHVRSEIYAARRPDLPADESPGAQFRHLLEVEQQSLARAVLHNSAQQIAEMVDLLAKAKRFFLVGDSYPTTAAATVAQQLRQWGIPAVVVETEAVERAATLAQLCPGDLVIGLSASTQGGDTARAMQFAQSMGVHVLAVVGDLASPVSRAADHVLYAPTLAPPLGGDNRLPSVVPLLAALFALVLVACRPNMDRADTQSAQFDLAYRFLTDEGVEAAQNGEAE